MLPILKKYTKRTAGKVKKVRCTGAPACNQKGCGHFWEHIWDGEEWLDCRPGMCMTFDTRIKCVDVEFGPGTD